MTVQLSAAQQAQMDNRDDFGKWKQKSHTDVEDTAGVLGVGVDDADRPEPLDMSPNRDRGEPKVWLGSEGAYAAGRLVGDWYAAEDAEDVTVADLYRANGEEPDPDAGDEIAVMDHEGFDVGDHVTISPAHAVELAQDFETVESEHGEDGVEAYKAMIRDQGFGDHKPGPDEFSEAYAGDYGSKEEWAEQFIDDTFPSDVDSETLERLSYHVDTDRLERDLEIEDPGVDYDDLDEVMEHIERESVESQIIEDNGGEVPDDLDEAVQSKVEEWIADEDHGAIDQHIEPKDYADEAEELVKSWVDNGDIESIKTNLDYESYARDAEMEGSTTFLDKHDGVDGVHVFYN
ncbi:antirestriction protein ArdA [Nesterenkonia cremea]|nr:antirestriction protein ArdA [Nesterenkonia cremea]